MKMSSFTPQHFADLPEKKKGRHRFIAIASYVISHETAVKAIEGTGQAIMDQENIWDLSIGCIDCEQPYEIGMTKYCQGPEYKDPKDGN